MQQQHANTSSKSDRALANRLLVSATQQHNSAVYTCVEMPAKAEDAGLLVTHVGFNACRTAVPYSEFRGIELPFETVRHT